jgi:hypothetical protein
MKNHFNKRGERLFKRLTENLGEGDVHPDAAALSNLANRAQKSGIPVGYYTEIIEKAIAEYDKAGHEKVRSTSRGLEVHKVTWEEFWKSLTDGYINGGHLEEEDVIPMGDVARSMRKH